MPQVDQLAANTALVEEFFADAMNNADPQKGLTLLAPGFIVHHSMLPGGKGGVSAVTQLMTTFRAAFPDLHYDVADHVAQDDLVATRWVATAHHAGIPFFGVAALNPPVAVSVGGTDVFRIANGKIAETWVCSDMLSLAGQLGAYKPPVPGVVAEPAAP